MAGPSSSKRNSLSGALAGSASTLLNSEPTTFKVRAVMLGRGGVGKTALVHRFLWARFADDYQPTVENLYHGRIPLQNGIVAECEIVDTAGTLAFPAMRRLHMRTAHAFILVCSVDDANSVIEMFAAVQECIDARKDRQPPAYVFVINKMDLPGEKHRVTAAKVSHLMAQLPVECKPLLVETSAKYNLGVDAVFGAVTKNSDNLKQALSLHVEWRTLLSADSERRARRLAQEAAARQARGDTVIGRFSANLARRLAAAGGRHRKPEPAAAAENGHRQLHAAPSNGPTSSAPSTPQPNGNRSFKKSMRGVVNKAKDKQVDDQCHVQ